MYIGAPHGALGGQREQDSFYQHQIDLNWINFSSIVQMSIFFQL